MASGGEHGDRVGSDGAPPHVIDSVRLAASELVSMSVVPATLVALLRLNVFEALAAAGDGARLTADELSQLAMPGKPVNVTYLARMLRMMSSEKILSEVVTTGEDGLAERRFGLEPIGKLFVEDTENGSFAYLLHWSQNPVCMRAWDHLHESVVDDSLTPFARANGGLSPWECGMRDPELNMTFIKAMAGASTLYTRGVLEAYTGFGEAKVLVDVGGGSGSTLSFIKALHPHIQGINFDMPHVVAAGRDIPDVVHVGGDFRESVPEGGDAILLKNILHDWDDATCVRILENCFKALPAHGKVILIDVLIPESSDFGTGDAMAFKVDVVMMSTFGSNARERTEGDFRKLALEAGFQQLIVSCKVDHISISELRK